MEKIVYQDLYQFHFLSDVVFSPGHGGSTSVGELGLTVKSTGRMLPCGSTGRWTP